MTVKAYEQAGLNRLTKKQRQALEIWLAQHLKPMEDALHPVQTTAAAPTHRRAEQAAISRFGLPRHHRPALSGDVLRSRIKGEFRGWSGSTRFHLTNGQTWVQTGPGYFSVPPMMDPRVEIKKLLLGYVLRVRGFGEQVFVTRAR